MDIYIDNKPTTLNKFLAILKSLNFKIKKRKKYYFCYLRKRGGRIHLMFTVLRNKIYCDLHFDKNIHLLIWGVDFEEKPEEYFNQELKKRLEKNNIKFKTKQVNWFSRRNKASFGHFKL